MLLDHIKQGRRKHRGKQPLPETVFAAVAAIVQQFHLRAIPAGAAGPPDPAARPGRRLSLFPLLSAAQYRLAGEIIARYDNPYLVYARSPRDFALSRRLYEQAPNLTTQELQEFSLEFLYRRETKG